MSFQKEQKDHHLKAIEESKTRIIVFSENLMHPQDSVWIEFAKIVQCKEYLKQQIFFPIDLYKVHPSEGETRTTKNFPLIFCTSKWFTL